VAVGHPSLLTPEKHREFMQALRTGVPIKVAAAGVGLGESTVANWMTDGRKAKVRAEAGETLTDHEAAMVRFADEAAQVYQEVHLLLAGRVVQASAKDWRAATWMLTRRHADVWAPDTVEVHARIEVDAVLSRAREYLDVEPASSNGQHELPDGAS
jgi:hypothetical protein